MSFKRTIKKSSSILVCTIFVIYVIEKVLKNMYMTDIATV